MSENTLNDCFRYDGQRLSHEQAVTLLQARLQSVVDNISVPVMTAAGHVLSAPVTAPRDVPPHTNAAVDGFALRYRDYDQKAGTRLPLAGRAAAGAPFQGPVPNTSAIRVLTGAVVPPELDLVVMQEDCRTGTAPDNWVDIPAGLRQGINIRAAGEDVQAGAAMFEAGHVLRPQDVAGLCSIGIDSVACRAPLKVAIVSTGDEVIRPGTVPVTEGAVFDTNAAMLTALCKLCGVDVFDAGIWPDDRTVTTERLTALAKSHDVVLTSGGASGGDEDHISAVLNDLGTCHFWQIAIKPGRPLMFGQIGSTIVAGLPGNPVAVFVCFLIYIWPMLRCLSGAGWQDARRWPAQANFNFTNRKSGRREFWRGHMRRSGDQIVVDKFQRDGSGLISGLRAADCLIEIPEDAGNIYAGDTVDIIPFTEFGIL